MSIKDIRAEGVHILHTCKGTEEQLEPNRSIIRCLLIRQLGEVGGKRTMSRLGRAGLTSPPLGGALPTTPGLPRHLRPGGEGENTYPPVLGLSWVSLHQLGAAPRPRAHAPRRARAQKVPRTSPRSGSLQSRRRRGRRENTASSQCKAEAGSPGPGLFSSPSGRP